MGRNRVLWLLLAALLLATRLAHVHVLWVEEGYPLAAAREILAGKTLYRDVWFDKPPWFAAIYTLWGAQTGWLLRIAGTLYALLVCWAVSRAASALESEQAGRWAAILTAVAFAFGIPSATLALTPDVLLMPFHALAVALAVSGQPFWAGVAAGAGAGFNAKALFVLGAVLIWQWRAVVRVLAGFALPCAASATWLAFQGSLRSFWDQVWVWGGMYARNTPFASPLWEGIRRTANWFGFQATGVAGTIVALRWRSDWWKLAIWLALSLDAVGLGSRFFPRYYFHLLVPVAVCGGIGLARLPDRWRRAALLLLVIPVIRFAPGHWRALTQPGSWNDLALYADARKGAEIVRNLAKPGDTLFVWGYRPEYYPLTGLLAGTPFLDSQPVSGVLADRHLRSAEVSAPEWAARNLPRLLASRPVFIVDGLGVYNPALALNRQEPLREWLSRYERVGQTTGSIIYHQRELTREPSSLRRPAPAQPRTNLR